MVYHFYEKSNPATSYGVFTFSHLLLVCVTVFFIIVALVKNRHHSESEVLRTTRWFSVFLWVLEVTKIIFNILTGNADNPNAYVPLYFCSLPLYCLPMSAFGRGRVKRIGDVFMAVGGLAGGVVYLIFPNTSAAYYPAIHLITFQSFILHGIMIYLSLLYMLTGYCRPVLSDWKYYSAAVVLLCFAAAVVNHFLGSNLMFLSEPLLGTTMEFAYALCPSLYPLTMALFHAIPPFFVVYWIMKAFCIGSTRHKNLHTRA